MSDSIELVQNDEGVFDKFEGIKFSSKKVADEFFNQFLKLEKFSTMDEVKAKIKECEGKHKQQIAYSSYHDSLTQVCFDCMRVRTNLKD